MYQRAVFTYVNNNTKMQVPLKYQQQAEFYCYSTEIFNKTLSN